MLNGNKRRIYLAYFDREYRESNPVKFHTALLITPKNPDVTSNSLDGLLIHIKNGPDPKCRREAWFFQVRNTRVRTFKLHGLLLLGKIPNSVPNEKIVDLLSEVPRLNFVGDDVSWRCRHWIWSCLLRLSEMSIIPTFDCDPSKIWQAGYDFVKTNATGDSELPVPTCDVSGIGIGTEVGPLCIPNQGDK